MSNIFEAKQKQPNQSDFYCAGMLRNSETVPGVASLYPTWRPMGLSNYL